MFCNWYIVTPPIVTAYTFSPNNGTVSRSHSLFPSGPRLVRIPECGRKYMLSSLWFGLGLYAFGMENGVDLPIVCVTVTVRVHAVVCYHSFVYERVSELSRLPQLSVGEQHSKVNNSTSPLFLVAIFKACFR